MAVELRCPDCRAKLRLKVAPEAGTEVECPKCATVFPAPEPEPDADEDAPKKKKATEDGEEKPKKDGDKKEKKTKTKKGAAGADPKGPKKRKAKKKETSKVALIGVICASVLMLICMASVLIWFFTRTSKAVEMFYYVPEDAQDAVGMNLGHAQKYPEFYKSLKSFQEGTDYKTAGDAVAKAAGTDMDSLVDYVAKATSSKNGWAIVYRTKAEFDDGALAKIPGADKKSLDGKTYYIAPNMLPGNESARVFAPTNRLIVVCSANTTALNDSTFKKMLNGHADSKEKTLGVRMGELGKRVTRGTFWQMSVFDNEMKAPTPAPAPGASQDDAKAQLARTVSETVNGAKGMGVKASLGSRELRFEIVVWYKDNEKSSSVAKKWKESELGKGDEGTPPKWFKDETQNMGDRKVAAQLLSNIGFGAAGELFYVKSAVDTLDIQQTVSTALGKVTGQTKTQNTANPGGTPGAPPGGAPPKMPRRPNRVRSRR